MKELIKHNLDFKKTSSFFVNQIASKKGLSAEIICEIDFKGGVFFTLLPKNANIERLYSFKGSIIPNEIVDGETFFVSIDRECSAIIKNFISKKDNLAIFEDYFATPSDYEEIEGTRLAFYEDQDVYYFLNSETPLDSVYSALRSTSHVWLFLGILGSNIEYKCHLDNRDFSLICSNINYIITSAYDGEGYIFWERLQN